METLILVAAGLVLLTMFKKTPVNSANLPKETANGIMTTPDPAQMYYNANGLPYTNEADSYWFNEYESRWYHGTLDGRVEPVGAPPFLANGALPVPIISQPATSLPGVSGTPYLDRQIAVANPITTPVTAPITPPKTSAYVAPVNAPAYVQQMASQIEDYDATGVEAGTTAYSTSYVKAVWGNPSSQLSHWLYWAAKNGMNVNS